MNLKNLPSALPIHAEEGPHGQSLPETELLTTIAEANGDDSARAILDFIRRLLESFCLLDSAELAGGNWKFVSYPAYLCARSFCETLATPGQCLVEADYWQQGDHRPAESELEQRKLIERLEFARTKLAPRGSAVPIRTAYVAWGIVRLGGKYLMHRDKKAKGKHYGFPGGRLNLNDFQPMVDPISVVLRRLDQGDVDFAAEFIERALKRELKEELKLFEPEHYRVVRRRTLDPYCKLGKNQPAYSQYFISMHEIRLTPEGEAQLMDTIDKDKDEELEWFSIDDLLAPKGRIDGKTTYIDVLRDQQGKHLQRFLESFHDSSGIPFRLTKDSDAVDIPTNISQEFWVGSNRHMSERAIALNASELALLTTLVASARDLYIALTPKHLKPLGGGWIKYVSDEAMATGQALARKLDSAELPLVVNIPSRYVRLAIRPNLVYFADSGFAYSVENPTLRLSLHLNLGQWADSCICQKDIPLDSTLVRVVVEIQKSGFLEASDAVEYGSKDLDKKIRTDIDPGVRAIGLRKLIRFADEEYRIAVPFAI